MLHGLVGTLMPLLMVMMMPRFFGRNRSWTEGLSIAPFALFAGLAFTIPYTLTGVFWGPEFPSLVGALGAFIAGSNTISNLMFSLFQHGIDERQGVSGALVVALQAVGAAAGNMIAIHNVVAASATVGLLGQEGTLLRKTILPILYYVGLAGLLGLVATYWLCPLLLPGPVSAIHMQYLRDPLSQVSSPNQPRRSIHFVNSSTGEMVKARVMTITQSISGKL